jgi:hypothetical protein
MLSDDGSCVSGMQIPGVDPVRLPLRVWSRSLQQKLAKLHFRVGWSAGRLVGWSAVGCAKARMPVPCRWRSGIEEPNSYLLAVCAGHNPEDEDC